MKYLLLPILFFATTICLAETITSEFPCGETKKVTDYLKERYNEAPIMLGRADDTAHSLMSLWVNKTTGTWTILATLDELTCIIGTGTNLNILVPKGKAV